MKLRLSLIAAAAAFYITAGQVRASTVLNLGTTFVGETNTITETANFTQGYSAIITGVLNPGTMITFSYTFSGLSGGNLYDHGSYDFNKSGTHYHGFATSTSSGFTSSHGSEDSLHPLHFSTVNSLVLTTANLTPTSGTATIVDSSVSKGPADFITILSGFLKRGGRVVINYTVTGLSSVPLPASAPLFGLGLMLFIGMGMRKRKRASASL
jgi:hypothetical protein